MPDEKKDTIENLQGYIAILAIVGITLHLLMRFVITDLTPYQNYPLYAVLLFGGMPLVWDLIRKLFAFEFGSDLLAGLSIVTSIILDEYLAGSLVVLMLSGGLALENYAISRASKVLEALAKRAPTIAHKKSNGTVTDINVKAIAIGDQILVYPHEICPVDAIVTEGNGVMDESFLTGEPFMISKAPGVEVISGSINGDSALTIQATKIAEDSRFAKIMRVLNETEQKRPRMRRLADQLGAWYTPIAVIIAVLAWLLSSDPVRFLAVLVVATPCPLLIAIPVAIIGSISLCASRSILIKNPIVLEQVKNCTTMIFDKTGTLTYGRPILTDENVFNGMDKKEILTLVSSLEKYSKHPLANAIMDKAKSEKIMLLDATSVNEPKGAGLEGKIKGHDVVITSRKGIEKLGLKDKIAQLPEGIGLECIVLVDGQLAASYRFHDEPRNESQLFVRHLFPKHGFNKIMIVSGDREEEVKYLADAVGIKEVYANKSPEEKVDIVVAETKKAKTMYVGDGINDAPALVAATIGVAFGQNSDVTTEAAGVVIMDSSIKKVDEFIHIAERMRKIALQSAVGGMALSIVGMLIAAFGYLPPVAGAISQEVIDVVAILNSLRTIWRPKQLSDL